MTCNLCYADIGVGFLWFPKTGHVRIFRTVSWRIKRDGKEITIDTMWGKTMAHYGTKGLIAQIAYFFPSTPFLAHVVEQLRPCGAWVANMHQINKNNFYKNLHDLSHKCQVYHVSQFEEFCQITLNEKSKATTAWECQTTMKNFQKALSGCDRLFYKVSLRAQKLKKHLRNCAHVEIFSFFSFVFLLLERTSTVFPVILFSVF